jgi:hypothetical protein
MRNGINTDQHTGGGSNQRLSMYFRRIKLPELSVQCDARHGFSVVRMVATCYVCEIYDENAQPLSSRVALASGLAPNRLCNCVREAINQELWKALREYPTKAERKRGVQDPKRGGGKALRKQTKRKTDLEQPMLPHAIGKSIAQLFEHIVLFCGPHVDREGANTADMRPQLRRGSVDSESAEQNDSMTARRTDGNRSCMLAHYRNRNTEKDSTCRWTPQHSSHTITPNVIEAHSGLRAPQSTKELFSECRRWQDGTQRIQSRQPQSSIINHISPAHSLFSTDNVVISAK